MFDRSDDDIAAGVIRLPLGGREYILPTLPWEASDEWQGRFKQALHDIAGADFTDLDTGFTLLSTAMGTLVDLVAAYDVEHKLGRNAEDLRKHFDRAQIYEVFKAIARHEFPFLRDAEGAVTMLTPILRPLMLNIVAAVASRQASTTSGASPTGASTPELSVVSSTDDSSTSSGKRARSG